MNPGPLLKAAFSIVCLLGAAAAAQEQTPAPPPAPELPQNANEYVRGMIDHELEALKQDHTHWRYHLHREDDKNNYDRDVIETSQGSLARTLLLWGKPLTAEQREKDEERMRKLVSDPEERAQRAKREREDDERIEKMLRAIAQAFIFKYEDDSDGVLRLSFVPNPHWEPPSMELHIFRSLKGNLWADLRANRLAGIDGTLVEDVTFGWGLLGRLYKGGTFKVTQKDIGGHWTVVAEEVNMTGRAVLFKTITRKQREIFTGFSRVPDSITMAEAYEMLQKPAVPAENQRAEASPSPGKD